MQRKEEMKRHELYERRSRAELASSDLAYEGIQDSKVGDFFSENSARSSKSNALQLKRRRGPTIVREEPFPLSNYSFSRQCFHVEETVLPEKKCEDETIDNNEQFTKKRRTDWLEEIEDPTGRDWKPSCSHETTSVKDSESEPGANGAERGGVFFPSGSCRAPKLTKSLEARLKKAARK